MYVFFVFFFTKYLSAVITFISGIIALLSRVGDVI